MKGYFLQCQIQLSLSCHAIWKQRSAIMGFSLRLKELWWYSWLQKDESADSPWSPDNFQKLATIFIYHIKTYIVSLDFQVSGHIPEEEFPFPSLFQKLLRDVTYLQEPRHQEGWNTLLMLSVDSTYLSLHCVSKYKCRLQRMTLSWKVESIFSSSGTKKIPA